MKIAFFDFDGTLTRHDTLFTFARFSRGRAALARALIKSAPAIVLWKMGLRSNSYAKQRLFSALYKGMPYSKFQEYGRDFAALIAKDLRTEIYEKLLSHKAAGHRTVIVTASIGDWIRPWAQSVGIDHVIATEAEVTTTEAKASTTGTEIAATGKLTGRFATPNCHGPEKARRILQAYPDLARHETWAYGDSAGDTAMLRLATHPSMPRGGIIS